MKKWRCFYVRIRKTVAENRLRKTPTEVFTCKKAKRHEPNVGVGDTWRDAQFSFHIKVFTSPSFSAHDLHSCGTSAP